MGGFDQLVTVVIRVLFLPTCCKQCSEGTSWIHHIIRCGFNIFSFLSSDGNVRWPLNQELTDTLCTLSFGLIKEGNLVSHDLEFLG